MTTPFVLILGADGQLGSELCARHDALGLSFVAADHVDCNIESDESVRAFFQAHSDAGLVYNAAAFTAVDAAESTPEKAYAVNAEGAARVAAAAREIGASLVHFSTDFVFGEGHSSPLTESAIPAPLSVYGASKLAGERLALQNNPATMVLRTSGLYSHHGNNFVRSIARYAREKGHLKVVADQVVTPTSAESLARTAMELATAPLFLGGVYHATAHGECSWFEFASKIVELLGIDATLEPTTAAEWGAAARRPSYSVLDNHRLRLRGFDHFRPWEEELRDFLQSHGADL